MKQKTIKAISKSIKISLITIGVTSLVVYLCSPTLWGVTMIGRSAAAIVLTYGLGAFLLSVTTSVIQNS